MRRIRDWSKRGLYTFSFNREGEWSSKRATGPSVRPPGGRNPFVSWARKKTRVWVPGGPGGGCRSRKCTPLSPILHPFDRDNAVPPKVLCLVALPALRRKTKCNGRLRSRQKGHMSGAEGGGGAVRDRTQIHALGVVKWCTTQSLAKLPLLQRGTVAIPSDTADVPHDPSKKNRKKPKKNNITPRQ
jgi:hypothetical protein